MEFTGLDLEKKLANVLVIKGKVAGEKSKEDDSAGPNVGGPAVIVFARDDFRGSVVRGTARGLEHSVGGLQGGHAEVGYFDVSVLIEKKILGFEIAVARKGKKKEKLGIRFSRKQGLLKEC